jgi:hypothetical protein
VDHQDVLRLILTQFVDQLDVVSRSRKIVNVELNLEVELELVQEQEQEVELAQEQEVEPHSNIQDLDLPLLQLPMVHMERIQTIHIVPGAPTQHTVATHIVIGAPTVVGAHALVERK